MPRFLALFALVASVSLLACTSDQKLVSGCKEDADCGAPAASWQCLTDTGECRCRDTGACKDGETCNSQGYCQAKVGCYVTQDCPQGFFCDASTNTCLETGRCTSDVHCAQGTLCDLASHTCKAGCRSNGDCALRDTCLCKVKNPDGSDGEGPCTCEATTPSERAKCAIGRCASGTCSDNGFCAFGERCMSTPDSDQPVCQSDYDADYRPYCDKCVYQPGQDTCGKGPNFCITETLTRTTYCGADCSDGQDCPNGYRCRDIVVVYSRWECYSDADCGTPDRHTTQTCQKDEDCQNGGLCSKAAGATSGFCAGRCFIREGATRGFCSCVVDDDCYQDTCDTTTRTCSVTRRNCTLEGAGCRPIRCVDMGGHGGCLIGQNCTPLEGLTCADVRPNK